MTSASAATVVLARRVTILRIVTVSGFMRCMSGISDSVLIRFAPTWRLPRGRMRSYRASWLAFTGAGDGRYDMPGNITRAFYWCWAAGTVAWIPWEAGRTGLFHLQWLPGWLPFSGLLLPDQRQNPAMPDLPGTTLLTAIQDLFLPPLIVLMAGLIIGWVLRSRWRA
jgi:hypothetical protein